MDAAGIPHAPDSALTVGLALAAGMVAQVIARHLRVPGIVLLLAAGVLLGPDLLGVVRPELLGGGLQTLVGFAVAVILFEGGLNLNVSSLRRQGRPIRQLLTYGVVVTTVGGALAARLLMEWDWRRAILFGTLVIVTGPTVITPLLRRIKLQRRLATVLEAEGVLVDAVGAIVAVVALEVALSPSSGSIALGFWHVLSRLVIGAAMGAAGGVLMALVLKRDWLVPEGLQNVFTLSLVVALFQLANTALPESGIVAAAVAGIAVGNVRHQALGELKEFKEQLTVLFIGMLFVLLAADVRVEQVLDLGWAGVATVAALMFVVRPLNVVAGTWGTNLTTRERVFLSWLAPRGIVAAAVASLFATSLQHAGLEGGTEMRALVFLVIAATVLIQGLSGGLFAGLLGLRRPSDDGFAILGAGELGRAFARLLKRQGQDVVLIDSSPDNCRRAEEEDLRVLHGSALAESVLRRAELDTRAGCLAITSNDEVNHMFAAKARREFKVARVWVALRAGHVSVTPKMVEEIGAHVLLGRPRNLDLWSLRLERGVAGLELWPSSPGAQPSVDAPGDDQLVLPLAVVRGRSVRLADETLELRPDDVLAVLVFGERREAAEAWLTAQGWLPPEAEVRSASDLV